MNGADVLPNDAQRDQLHRAKKEEAEDNRRQAHRKAIPEDKFVNEVEHPGEEAEKRGDKAEKDDQAQRNLREIRDPQHREVVKRVEIVRSDPALAAFLVVENLGDGSPSSAIIPRK